METQSKTLKNQFTENELSLREIVNVIWLGKYKLLIILVISSILSVAFALSQPDIYKSEALLAPAEGEQGGGLASLAGQLGGLASLAGVNVGGQTSNKVQLAIEILQSRQFFKQFLNRHQILPDLMAAKSWDRENNSVVYDESIYDPSSKKWVREVSLPLKTTPSYLEAYDYFRDTMLLNVDKDTGMLTLSIMHISPTVAHKWVTLLIEDINREMKKRDVLEANKSTHFLIEQIEKTNVADMKSILYKLIEEQAKTIMFANVRDEYVFKVIDAPVIPEIKAKPKRALICILGAFIGFTIGLIYILAEFFIRRDSN